MLTIVVNSDIAYPQKAIPAYLNNSKYPFAAGSGMQ
jgi:hypothetical protein